jgi:thymidylate synthase
MGLGVPFDIAMYALLTRLIAQVVGLKAGELIHMLGDTHVYKNHIEPLKEQLKRQPKPFPKLEINPDIKNIEDFKFSDLKLINYEYYPNIEMKMAL